MSTRPAAVLPFSAPRRPERLQTDQWLTDCVKQAQANLAALRQHNDKMDALNAYLDRGIDAGKKTLADLRELRLDWERRHAEHLAFMAAYRGGADLSTWLSTWKSTQRAGAGVSGLAQCYGCGEPATTTHGAKPVCGHCSRLTGLGLREAMLARTEKTS